MLSIGEGRQELPPPLCVSRKRRSRAGRGAGLSDWHALQPTQRGEPAAWAGPRAVPAARIGRRGCRSARGGVGVAGRVGPAVCCHPKMEFLLGNPFSTPVGQSLGERAAPRRGAGAALSPRPAASGPRAALRVGAPWVGVERGGRGASQRVDLCARVHVCGPVHTSVPLCACPCLCLCTLASVAVCVCVRMCMCFCAHLHLCLCLHTCRCVGVPVRVCASDLVVCACVCASVRVSVCVCGVCREAAVVAVSGGRGVQRAGRQTSVRFHGRERGARARAAPLLFCSEPGRAARKQAGGRGPFRRAAWVLRRASAGPGPERQ